MGFDLQGVPQSDDTCMKCGGATKRVLVEHVATIGILPFARDVRLRTVCTSCKARTAMSVDKYRAATIATTPGLRKRFAATYLILLVATAIALVGINATYWQTNARLKAPQVGDRWTYDQHKLMKALSLTDEKYKFSVARVARIDDGNVALEMCAWAGDSEMRARNTCKSFFKLPLARLPANIAARMIELGVVEDVARDEDRQTLIEFGAAALALLLVGSAANASLFLRRYKLA